MKDWDLLPFEPQPDDPAKGSTWEYEIPEGKIGRLYWLNIELTATASAGEPRILHVELGLVMSPSDNGNWFSPVAFFDTGTFNYVLAPECPEYLGDDADPPFQMAPLPRTLLQTNDYYWHLSAYWGSTLNATDQVKVRWLYKEQDWE